MITKKVDHIPQPDNPISIIRRKDRDEFIAVYGSNYLITGNNFGLDVDHLYISERVFYEIGPGFDVFTTRESNEQAPLVELDGFDPFSCSYNNPIFAQMMAIVERHVSRNMFPEDKYELMEYMGEPVLVLTETSLDIPEDCVIMAFLTTTDDNHVKVNYIS